MLSVRGLIQISDEHTHPFICDFPSPGGFNSDRTNTRSLKNNWGESAAYVISSANG